MARIFEGDEWKYAKAPERAPDSRAAEQSSLNFRYAMGWITVEQWRRESDELSEPTRGSYAK